MNDAERNNRIDDVFFRIDEEGRLRSTDNRDSQRDADKLYSDAMNMLESGSAKEASIAINVASEAYRRRLSTKIDHDALYKLALLEAYKFAIGKGDCDELSTRCENALTNYEIKIRGGLHPGMIVTSYLRKARLLEISGQHEAAKHVYSQTGSLVAILEQAHNI